jgi:5-methylcytosine-specific restriction endonuclease McrA
MSTVIVVGVILAFLFLILLLRRYASGAMVQRDPQRDFSAAQRREGFARAGHRCEHKPLLWLRCTAAPTHGDHIYPHSRGGATSLANFQALCARHNLAKADRAPSRFYIWYLERRRRRYFRVPEQARVEYRIGVRSIV